MVSGWNLGEMDHPGCPTDPLESQGKTHKPPLRLCPNLDLLPTPERVGED